MFRRRVMSAVSDADLDSLIRPLILEHPEYGSRAIKVSLEHRGVRVSLPRVLECLGRIDPEGVEIR